MEVDDNIFDWPNLLDEMQSEVYKFITSYADRVHLGNTCTREHRRFQKLVKPNHLDEYQESLIRDGNINMLTQLIERMRKAQTGTEDLPCWRHTVHPDHLVYVAHKNQRDDIAKWLCEKIAKKLSFKINIREAAKQDAKLSELIDIHITTHFGLSDYASHYTSYPTNLAEKAFAYLYHCNETESEPYRCTLTGCPHAFISSLGTSGVFTGFNQLHGPLSYSQLLESNDGAILEVGVSAESLQNRIIYDVFDGMPDLEPVTFGPKLGVFGPEKLEIV